MSILKEDGGSQFRNKNVHGKLLLISNFQEGRKLLKLEKYDIEWAETSD